MTPPPGSRVRKVNERFANIYLAVSALVMVVLVIVVVILVIRVSSVADDNHSNSVTACQQANISRVTAQEIDRDILALPAIASPQFITPSSAARQRAAVAVIQGKIRSAYALHNCVAQYSTKLARGAEPISPARPAVEQERVRGPCQQLPLTPSRVPRSKASA